MGRQRPSCSLVTRRGGLPPTSPIRDQAAKIVNLLVVADAAAQIADFGDESHLRNRRFVGTGPWPHVANLSDLTFRLLRRCVEVRAGRRWHRAAFGGAQ